MLEAKRNIKRTSSKYACQPSEGGFSVVFKIIDVKTHQP